MDICLRILLMISQNHKNLVSWCNKGSTTSNLPSYYTYKLHTLSVPEPRWLPFLSKAPSVIPRFRKQRISLAKSRQRQTLTMTNERQWWRTIDKNVNERHWRRKGAAPPLVPPLASIVDPRQLLWAWGLAREAHRHKLSGDARSLERDRPLPFSASRAGYATRCHTIADTFSTCRRSSRESISRRSRGSPWKRASREHRDAVSHEFASMFGTT